VHRQLSWRKDPKILERLPKVERWHLQGWTNYRIADALGLSEAAIRKDLERVRLLWTERANDDIALHKAEAVATYRQVQQAAWERFEQASDKSLNKSAFLNTVKSAEDSIVKVLGLEAPLKVAPTTPDGTQEYAVHAHAVIAAERAYLLAVGIQLPTLGGPARDVDSPAEVTDSVSPLSLSGEAADGSVAPAADRESAADRL